MYKNTILNKFEFEFEWGPPPQPHANLGGPLDSGLWYWYIILVLVCHAPGCQRAGRI